MFISGRPAVNAYKKFYPVKDEIDTAIIECLQEGLLSYDPTSGKLLTTNKGELYSLVPEGTA